MATISSPGLGSGLDINGIVSSLMQVESQPLTVLARKEASFQAKLSAFGALKGALSSLQTATKALTTSSTFTGWTASSSDSTVLSATSASTAAAGTYNIAIVRRAKNHTLATQTPYTASTDTFNTGALAITVGGTTKNITIDSTNNTLEGIRQAINDANAGVTASIVNTGTAEQYRLVLTSSTTGSAGAVSIAASDDGSGGTHPLGGLDTSGIGLGVIQAADDATLTVNGITITRSSNTITDAIDGVTLTLAKDTGTSTVTVARNTGAVNSAISAFVKAYNDVNTQIKNLTAYDAANKKASVLTGDSTARSVQSQLTALVGAAVSGITGGIATLSDIGISIQKDGTLTTDSTKLQAALNNRDFDLATLFGSTTAGNKGIAVRFNEMLEGVVGSAGLISSRTDGINASIKDIQKRGEALQLRLLQVEKRYRAQFSALDVLVASMNQTSNYLTQQLANLPGASNNNR
jgi:flagellar hook-associated protein 2